MMVEQFKWIFCLKIVFFEESLSALPFQINLTIIFSIIVASVTT